MTTDPTRVSVNHCSIVLGLGWRKTAKLLARVPMYPPDKDGLYDSRVLDLIRAMRGQPHRALEPVDNDWLARYLEETHAPRPQEPRPARRP